MHVEDISRLNKMSKSLSQLEKTAARQKHLIKNIQQYLSKLCITPAGGTIKKLEAVLHILRQ